MSSVGVAPRSFCPSKVTFMVGKKLPSYNKLSSQGWEHVANVSSYQDAVEKLAELKLQNDAYEYTVGEPRLSARHTCSGIQLQCAGVVGIYRRGGRPTPFAPVDGLPSSPLFVEPTPVKPAPQTKPGRITDKPPLEVTCAA